MKKLSAVLSLALWALATTTPAQAVSYRMKQAIVGMKSPTCELAGTPVADGASVLAYASASSSFGSCLAETRTCTQGTLSGSYPYATCTENPSTTTWGLPSDSRPTVIIFSNNNLTVGDADWGIATSVAGTTAHSTGKWYFELSFAGTILGCDLYVGLTDANWASGVPWTAAIRNSCSYNGVSGPSGFGGNVSNNVLSGFTYGSGDTVMFAVDLDAKKIWAGKNCAWASGNPDTGVGPSATLVNPINVRPLWNTTSTWTRPVNYNQTTGNFGGSAFRCTVPTGFHAGW